MTRDEALNNMGAAIADSLQEQLLPALAAIAEAAPEEPDGRALLEAAREIVGAVRRVGQGARSIIL